MFTLRTTLALLLSLFPSRLLFVLFGWCLFLGVLLGVFGEFVAVLGVEVCVLVDVLVDTLVGVFGGEL